MKNIYSLLISSLISLPFYSQQIAIRRIEMMSNIPADYEYKKWKKTALHYDDFIFDLNKTGEHLPLANINPSAGVNYPEINHIRMDTYVGQQNHGRVAEAINIMPAVVSASLLGRDKTIHYDVDWVEKIKDFYNLRNRQNVYLNNYSANTGNDWWYETMPNIFFYQLLSLYPQIDEIFNEQFTTVANRWLEVVYKLGGTLYPWQYPNMNFRSFNLLTGEPRIGGVPEPEAAGAIAWILYQAYKQTDKIEYLYGSELALDFLQNHHSNPSYEIQLPYGILTAAQMNAIEGTNYDIDKFLNWAFSSGIGTLRGWGCIVGNWNGYDMSGLIGEANDRGNDYAFSMNGFQHAAALSPLVKYDKRYARAIAKWLLNLSNSSRYFYTDALPPENQEQNSYAWSNNFDENSCVPYESIKENWHGTKPFAMGDAVTGGWAATNLSLYSGSSLGYMAALIDSTNINGILSINLNITDFRGCNDYPAYLLYNPHDIPHNVMLNVGNEPVDIYDRISETIIFENITGEIYFQIEADNVVMPVIIPVGKELEAEGRILKVKDEGIIDYHYGYNYDNELRIKVFASDKDLIVYSEKVTLNCTTENSSETVNYQLYVNGLLTLENTSGIFEWSAPSEAGEYLFYCKVTNSEVTKQSGEIKIRVIDPAHATPQIKKVAINGTNPFGISSQINIVAETNNVILTSMEWKCTGGRLENDKTLTPLWFLPDEEGIYEITLTINNDSGSDTKTERVLSKDFSHKSEILPFIYYPLNGDTKNKAQNLYHAVSEGALPAIDARGIENHAYKLTSPAEYIFVPNETTLNFNEKIAVSLWLKPDHLPNSESFVISHGSWEERYKMSIIPEKNLRWTLKTNETTIDIDDPEPLEAGKFVHYTGQYTGYSLELYRNGKLVAFDKLKGTISTTNKSITLARKDEQERNYNFRGTIDEVRIYDNDLSLSQIALLPEIWTLKRYETKKLLIYPNPVENFFYVEIPENQSIKKIEIINLSGQTVWKVDNLDAGNLFYTDISLNSGLYIVKAVANSNRDYYSKVVKK